MSLRPTKRRLTVAAAGVLGLTLTIPLAACGGGGSDKASDAPKIDCEQFKQFGDLKGKTISVYTGIVTPEDTPYIKSYKPFEDCTGAKVKYEGDKAFETQILVRAKAGNTPDIAIVPQPGLLKQLVDTGKAKEAPPEVAANVDKFWGKDWKAYATVDGKFYGAPSGASIKSLVWYSPRSSRTTATRSPPRWTS
ncbi:hypothetical protein GCM10027605_59990 [Micromonospora zhanjiangensis]